MRTYISRRGVDNDFTALWPRLGPARASSATRWYQFDVGIAALTRIIIHVRGHRTQAPVTLEWKNAPGSIAKQVYRPYAC